ncbi:type II toxin-antitoxin system Phd/YefM family antitoxin [Arthrobacter sp. SRS-W-1-2016]
MAEARSHFSRIVEQVSSTHERFEITRTAPVPLSSWAPTITTP